MTERLGAVLRLAKTVAQAIAISVLARPRHDDALVAR